MQGPVKWCGCLTLWQAPTAGGGFVWAGTGATWWWAVVVLPKIPSPPQSHQPVQDLCLYMNCKTATWTRSLLWMFYSLGSFLHMDSGGSRRQLKSHCPAPPCVYKTKIMSFKTSFLLLVTHHMSWACPNMFYALTKTVTKEENNFAPSFLASSSIIKASSWYTEDCIQLLLFLEWNEVSFAS